MTVAASTTANQACMLINIEKRRIYCVDDYPNGFADADVDDLIDLDEMGLFL